MNARERVLKAIAHEETDIIPYQINLTREAREKLVAEVGDPEYPEKIGNHIVMYEPGSFVEVRPDYFRDWFGVVWNRTVDKSIGVVERYPLQEQELSDFEFPEPEAVVDREQMERLLAENQHRFTTFGIGFSLFERAWTLRGMEQLLMDMLLDPGYVNELLDRILAYNLKLLEIGLEYDFDGIYFGDDWGQQNGLIMGPRMWRKFIKPRMAEMFARARRASLPVFLHSCGRVQELFPELIEIGLDVFNTFQPEIMDPREMKRRFGDRLTFYGGISTQQVLPYVEPDELSRIIRSMMADIGRGGGYIVAPTHAIPRDVPVENIMAFIEVVWNQCH